MKTLSEIKATLQNLLPDLQKRYSIVYLGIFGSYVRGEQTADSEGVETLPDWNSDLKLTRLGQ